MNKKMIAFAFAAIAYVAAAAGILLSADTLSRVAISLLGIFFAAASYVSLQEDKDIQEEKAKSDALSDELRDLRMEKAQVEAALHEKLSSSAISLEQIKITLKDAQDENENLRQQIDELLDETKEGERREKMISLLPPAKGGEDQEFDLVEAAQSALSQLSAAAKKAGVAVRVNAAEEHIPIRANADRIRILFRNIIDNSIKYMERSGSLVVTISAVGSDIFIVLKDDGMGLSNAETKRIFELNYQGSNRVSGNGLGLAQAKAITEYYGGTIYAKSGKGAGMGIYIQLPAK